MADPVVPPITSDYHRGLVNEKYSFDIKVVLLDEHFRKVWPTPEDQDDSFYKLVGPHFKEMSVANQLRLTADIIERAGTATVLRGTTGKPEPKTGVINS